jgi:hypothetical protein
MTENFPLRRGFFPLFLNLKTRKREKTVQNTVEENAFS